MFFFFFQAEDGIRDYKVTGVQTCALPIWSAAQFKGSAGAIFSGQQAHRGRRAVPRDEGADRRLLDVEGQVEGRSAAMADALSASVPRPGSRDRDTAGLRGRRFRVMRVGTEFPLSRLREKGPG